MLDRDRNLLFGVFAVQLKLVTPSQIMEGAAAWATDPSRDLPDRLAQINALSSADRKLIEGLVERAISEHGGDVGKTLATFGGQDAVEKSFCHSIVFSDGGEITRARAGLTVLGSPEAPEHVGVEEPPGRYTRESNYAEGA